LCLRDIQQIIIFIRKQVSSVTYPVRNGNRHDKNWRNQYVYAIEKYFIQQHVSNNGSFSGTS